MNNFLNHLSFVLILLSLVSFTYAQNLDRNAQFENNLKNAEYDLRAISIYQHASGSRIQNIEAKYVGIEGNPYLHEDWVYGDIHLVSGFIHRRVKVKLDVYNDMILYQDEDGLIALHKDYIQGFVLHLEHKTQKFEKINIEGKANTFYEIIYNGPSRLLKYYQKELIKTNSDQSYVGQDSDEFVDKDIFYLKTGRNKFEKIKLNKPSFIKKLNGKGNLIKEYFKHNPIDLKREREIVELLAYYDGK